MSTSSLFILTRFKAPPVTFWGLSDNIVKCHRLRPATNFKLKYCVNKWQIKLN